MSIPMNVIPGYQNSKPGIQIGAKLGAAITRASNGSLCFDEQEMRFLAQLGVEWVMLHGNQLPSHNAETYQEVKSALEERYGMKVYRLAAVNELHNISSVTLNLPDRDEMIERYLCYIRDLGKAGIRYATYAHMANGIWRTPEKRPVRGGAMATAYQRAHPLRCTAFGSFTLPMSHGREYSEDELWENYEYFIRRVVPVAEESGVYIGIHPDDPPVDPIGGVPRRIFGSFKGYKRAIELANSDHIGVCLCTGCWLEGGEEMGATANEAIRYFAGMKKLFKVHLRNVTAPMQNPAGFAETFPDDGYGDMVSIIKTLDAVGFDGCVMSDHLVDMVGGRYACEAYFTAYIKGMIDSVQHIG